RITYSGEDTFEDVIRNINNSGAGVTVSFDKTRAAFKIESSRTGKSAAITFDETMFDGGLFGAKGFDFNTAGNTAWTPDASRGESAASDATFEYNGMWMSRESNTFELDGVGVTLTKESEGQTFNVEVSRDVEPAVEAIKKFVEEYNKLVDLLEKQIATARPKSDKRSYYEPLTDEEREALSEDDIIKWEEKAKTGMLHRDNILTQIKNQMRGMVYTAVEMEDGSKLGLYNIGITTSAESNYAGKLQIDETKLRAALQENGDKVSQLFVKASDLPGGNPKDRNARLTDEGIGDRLDDIIKNAIDLNGSLYKHSGVTDKALSLIDNPIYRELNRYDQRMSDMLDYLQTREEYYYSMFAKMETAMSKSNSQMSSLTAMLGK
ncbi:MAG: flagellar filament capping protein FliD, partial [Clostridiales bacterium]|nr:flagellar filament capping protein FliD [Clostridiales bacterium]